MPGDAFWDWMRSDDWTEYRLQRRVREVQEEMDLDRQAQYRRSRAMQSRMSQVQGSLERRIDRMAEAFDAFVELSDLRLELAMFEEESQVRHRAQRLTRGLLRRATNPSIPPPPTLGLPPCPGYWLRSAAEGLAALVRGDEVTSERELAEADQLDAARTSAFMTLALTLTGQPAMAGPRLDAALPPLTETTTRTQRAMWRACARGVFGVAGTRLLTRRLAAAGGSGDSNREPARWSEAIDALVAANVVGRDLERGLPTALRANRDLIAPLVAAKKLASVRERLEELLAEVPGGLPTADAERPTDAEVTAAEFAPLLTELINEGSTDEMSLQHRTRELRQIIEGQANAPVASWDGEAGETLSLIRSDAFEEKDTALRAIALRSGSAWLRAIAGELLEEARRTPPERLTIKVSGHPVSIEATGTASFDRAFAEIDEAHAAHGAAEKLFKRREIADDIAYTRDRVQRDAANAATTLAKRVGEINEAAERAGADHARVVDLLGDEGR